jgi:hypothetical protein
MPTLLVQQPANNPRVKPNEPFLVRGQVTDKGRPEPNLIESVTVQVDSDAPVRATLTRIPNNKKTIVSFKASVSVTRGQDPHTVTITATNDIGISAKKTVDVFTGPIFQVASPAVVLDVLNPIRMDPKDPTIASWISEIQQELIPLSTSLASVGKKLIGPNLLFVERPGALQVMRLGLWIEDAGFPALRRSPPTFPLPRLSERAAFLGFGKVPILPIPNLAGISPSFALAIPIATLQHLVDAVVPGVKAASPVPLTLEITVKTESPGSVTTKMAGSAAGVDFTVIITEILGTRLLDDGRLVPAVIGSSSSVSVGSLFDLIVGLIIPFFGLALLDARSALSSAASDASKDIEGIIATLLAGIPTRIPFSNTLLPQTALIGLDFPVLVPNWKSFGVTGSAIQGTGTTSTEERDQSMVSMTIDGPANLFGSQAEFAGGALSTYNFNLINLAPDPDKFQWQVSGTNSKEGSIDRLTFEETGGFGAFFPLPRKVRLGTFPFTLSVDATETCGTDPQKKLSASNSRAVNVKVKKNPKVEP